MLARARLERVADRAEMQRDVGVIGRRDDVNRNVARERIVLEPFEHRQARAVGQADIEQHIAGNQPDFRTIADFRKLHLQALEALFQQVLRLVLEVGALKLGRVALDGSKVKANASKHKAMSYGRMGETEKRLREEVRRLLKQAEATDEEEDKRYGRERQGDELPGVTAPGNAG